MSKKIALKQVSLVRKIIGGEVSSQKQFVESASPVIVWEVPKYESSGHTFSNKSC